MTTETVDLQIDARWVIPVEPAGAVLPFHSVLIRNGRILAVLPTTEAGVRVTPRERRRLDEHILIPGLVNAHTHAAMSLMRGLADDLPLMRWLNEAIWPAESRHVSPDFVFDGSLLAAAEMLRGGITTCHDMYFYPDAAARAFECLGMRARIGMVVLEFPTPYAADSEQYLARGLAAREAWLDHPLIDFDLAPHAPYSVSDATFARLASLAQTLQSGIHVHLQETAQEGAESLARHGCSPTRRLAGLGLLGPDTLAVHGVHLAQDDLACLAEHGCSLAHCPTSNMKLASGMAPVCAMRAHGLNVALGTDGAASNNRLDIFQEMRLAALLAKVNSGDASALPAQEVLAMATINGARALGLDARIGSILPGKEADLCAVRIDDFSMQPCFNPLSHLIYVCGREQVSDVWVRGEERVRGHILLHNRHNELLGIARIWHTKLGL